MEKNFMKIVSYNINACTQDKVDFLLSLEADVYVVPEIANNITISPYEYTMEYLGDISSKGLGLIWKKGKLNIPDWFKDDYKKLSYAIPLICDDVLILGLWPTNYKKNKTYTKLAKEIIDKYTPHFSKYAQCIITGDFNLYHKENAPNKAADILEIDKMLTENGFHSVYHKNANEKIGYESRNTFYMHFKKDNPFFLDYTYSKLTVKNYYFIENPQEKFSDHIGQVIEI